MFNSILPPIQSIPMPVFMPSNMPMFMPPIQMFNPFINPNNVNPFLTNNSLNYSYPTFDFNIPETKNYEKEPKTNNSNSQNTADKLPEKVAKIAEKEEEKGIREIGSSNDSPEIRKYKNGQKNNYQWCGAFTSWCFNQVLGDKLFKHTYSSQEIRRQAEKNGVFAKKSEYKPQTGDIAIWTNVNDSAHGHVGIVTKVTNKGVYITEGNSGNAVKTNFYSYEKLTNERRFNGYCKTREWLEKNSSKQLKIVA